MEIRSFLAFELPPDIKRIISKISRAGKDLPLGLRWVKSENIHLTVVFLGNVPENRVQSIGENDKEGLFRIRPL